MARRLPGLAGLRVPGPVAIMLGRMALEEFLGHFVSAAVAADRRYVGLRDLSVHPRGDRGLGAARGERRAGGRAARALVDAQLAASALYVRRRRLGATWTLALRTLDEAQRHLAPGSIADLQARMSQCRVPDLRYRAEGRVGGPDGAIATWSGLLATDARALAAANLGRALLTRGGADDLPKAAGCWGLASAEMPPEPFLRGGRRLARAPRAAAILRG